MQPKGQKTALTLYAVSFNAKAILTGDFKAQVGLIHVCPLLMFR